MSHFVHGRLSACSFTLRGFFQFIACATALAMASPTWGQVVSHPIEKPIQPKGTVSFTLHTKRAFRNGAGVEQTKITPLKIPDLAEVSLQQSTTSVALDWRWLGAKGAPYFRPQITELPGPEDYFVQFTWDAEAGLFDFYVNGFPMRSPGVATEPWKFGAPAGEMLALDGPISVSDLRAEPHYLGPQDAGRQVPEEFRGRHAELFGQHRPAPAIAVEDRRGRLLLKAELATADDVRRWVMEGPGQITFQEGWMQMRSTRPDATGDENGHIVFWCPRDFPKSFVAEWEIQPVSELGLTIFFFAAKGQDGEDIFDPSLPKRDGTFSHYIGGAVKSYHVSYYANTPDYLGRMTSNLRKNNLFYLLASGPVAIPAKSKRAHSMRVIKDGGHIQLQADGRVIIDYTDPGGRRYGPVYAHGKIGFRQMQWMVARYRNFQVWELSPEPAKGLR